jgi:hypothetical protein
MIFSLYCPDDKYVVDFVTAMKALSAKLHGLVSCDTIGNGESYFDVCSNQVGPVEEVNEALLKTALSRVGCELLLVDSGVSASSRWGEAVSALLRATPTPNQLWIIRTRESDLVDRSSPRHIVDVDANVAAQRVSIELFVSVNS